MMAVHYYNPDLYEKVEREGRLRLNAVIKQVYATIDFTKESEDPINLFMDGDS